MIRKIKKKFAAIASVALGALLSITSTGIATNAQPAIPADAAGTSTGFTTAKAAADDTSKWKGFYIGVYGGGNFGRSDAATSTVFTTTGYFAQTSVTAINNAGIKRIKPSGFTGGGTIGYNHQSGNFVAGVEADFGAMRANETVTSTTTYPCCSPATFTITQSMKTSWQFTARPRIGVAAGNALIYGTGGVAVTDINYQAAFSDTFGSARENGGVNKNKAGWTLGGGVEFKAGSHWSLKGEYLYADFGSVNVSSTNLNANSINFRPGLSIASPSVAYPGNVFTHSADLKVSNVRFGINYHF